MYVLDGRASCDNLCIYKFYLQTSDINKLFLINYSFPKRTNVWENYSKVCLISPLKISRKSQINQAKTFLYHNKVQIIFRRKSLLKPKKKKKWVDTKRQYCAILYICRKIKIHWVLSPQPAAPKLSTPLFSKTEHTQRPCHKREQQQ